ncbi:LapA family protein [Paenarthrobacter nitroguajacolicus]|uniref:LapA family protein n=1 Tax=Paenarthrobacter nitroguajacolicus TaxID=211146 RepID=UPI0040546B24
MSFQDDAARIPSGSASPERGSPEHHEPVIPPPASGHGGASGHDRPTRTAALWVAVAVGLVVLVVLIAFFVQNQDMITVRFFGLEGTLALGTTLFIAAVGGGVLVALAGGARILQLRMSNHRRKKAVGGPGTAR